MPGGIHALHRNPPSVVIEVIGEGRFGTDVFLGRFSCTPTVISVPTDRRSNAKWYPLMFRSDKARFL